jgi:hypothetical protein
MDWDRSIAKIWKTYQGKFTILRLVLFACLAFSIVLTCPPPEAVTRVFYNFSIQISILLVIVLGLVFGKKGMFWESTSLMLTIVLFGLPLIYKWQTAKFDGVLFGGFLPWSDAYMYYSGAQRLMTGGYLNEVASWRPLFSGSLTTFLFLTANNLRLTLAVWAALNGIAVFLAGREIQKAHGAFAAALFVTVCYWYYCPIAGTAMTENLGFCFGSLGFACLLRGTESKNLRWMVSGLFVLTIALSIRAGAFFILPMLLLWFLILYQMDFGWKGFVLVSTAVLIAMTSNVIFKKVIGNPESVLFSNYSYTLYGLASGNAGWKQVLIDFPEAKPNEIYPVAIHKISQEPMLFVRGMARAFQDYFSMGSGGFSFLRLIGDKNIGNRLLWVFTLLGIAISLLTYKRPLSLMILMAFLGVLSSTLLVPRSTRIPCGSMLRPSHSPPSFLRLVWFFSRWP